MNNPLKTLDGYAPLTEIVALRNDIISPQPKIKALSRKPPLFP